MVWSAYALCKEFLYVYTDSAAIIFGVIAAALVIDVFLLHPFRPETELLRNRIVSAGAKGIAADNSP